MTAIPAEMIARWQSMVNILAELLDVPAGLIMQAEPPNHRVVVSSKTPQNPYAEGTSFVLHTGLYCDTVMEANADLLVHDAAASKQWRNNPDLEHGMSFYHGFPLSWPNGRIFGTICVLDRKDNPKAARYRDLLAEFKASIDVDLTLLVTIDEKMQLMEELRAGQDLLEERVKQRTAELSEVNATLRVLLRQLEVTRGEFELQVTDSLAERVLPHITAIRSATPAGGRIHLDLLEAGIRELTSSFSQRLSVTLSKLTPSESLIVQMIVQGHSSKEIARAISRATSTVDFHRNNIRRKLGIDSQKVSLRTYLNTLK